MRIADSIARRLSRRINRLLAPGRISRLESQGLPPELSGPLKFLGKETLSQESKQISGRIEALRQRVSERGSRKVRVLYSPKPGSSGTAVSDDLRPQHGKELDFSMEQIAKTGKNRRWGLFLHLLATECRAKTVLELGSCIGMSGCYLASASSCETFITVEGSPELAALAQAHIREFKPDAQVVNMLFDEALDELLPTLSAKIDFLFIDGHHEKIATIHYYQRISPYLSDDAVVVFDDISWSYDMRDAWKILCRREEFAHCADFGAVGVCLLRASSRKEPPLYWDLQKVLGRQRIGDPHGWKK